MKSAMYCAITILCLVAAFQLIAEPSRSSMVDMSASGVVAISDTNVLDGRVIVLDENGVAWDCHVGSGWAYDNDPGIPVPVSQVKFWCRSALVTHDNHLWMREPAAPWTWIDCGPWPGGASPVEQRSWGGIKSEFR